MVKGKAKIEIIQGDSYQKNVVIENVQHEFIDSVYISCKGLNICQQLTYSSQRDKYTFFLTRQETTDLPNGTYDYDLTIKFMDDIVKTIPYRESLVILPKLNKVGCFQ